jgi:ubiquinone/menaquinone biosynthesis C-methylase UbiE
MDKIISPNTGNNIELSKKNALEKVPKQINQIINHLNIEKGAKILEVGCGEGLTVAGLNLNGYEAYGVEPNEKYVKNAYNILEINNIDKNKIKQGFSENMPFKEEEFDYVVSFQVLEHVGDVFKTFQEIERVLKTNGETLHFAPNYNSFREGHFHVFMLPFMSKKNFYYWLKLLNLLTKKKMLRFSYLDHLNFITPKKLEKKYFPFLKKLKAKEIGGNILNQRIKNKESIFQDRSGNSNRPLWLKIFYFLEQIYLAKLFVFLISKFRVYPHLVVYGKKKIIKLKL